MNNEDKKIAKLVKESGNRSHKFSLQSESVFFGPWAEYRVFRRKTKKFFLVS
jgi:hypothetical protein